ncbi:MAG: hypothetical protein ACP5HS_00450 [Anaerolineae bacterium]
MKSTRHQLDATRVVTAVAALSQDVTTDRAILGQLILVVLIIVVLLLTGRSWAVRLAGGA